MTKKKTCFVVMGFGEKVDFQSGRKLNLDAAYKNMIKPAVEEAGLECRRADEIVHSGAIDVPMYREILTADVVVADLSTSNSNAFYELGVRHALRPYTTIIIAEDQFKFPFDLTHIVIRQYKHLGDDIGVSEANRFRGELKKAIDIILNNEKPESDSPVYTFLKGLRPPSLEEAVEEAVAVAVAAEAAAADPAAPPINAETHSALMQQVDAAQKRGDFLTAKALLSTVRELMRPPQGSPRPENPYVLQRLALVTYKSKHPTPKDALEEARALLEPLDPETSNDTETLGLWGAVHKRLWDQTKDPTHLDAAVRGYERGFYLRNDYYNGINLAFLLNLRAANSADPAEAVADFVQARRVRREVVSICESLLGKGGLPAGEKYWAAATAAEAYVGLGDEAKAQELLEQAGEVAPDAWMKSSTDEQIIKLRALLSDSPLKRVS